MIISGKMHQYEFFAEKILVISFVFLVGQVCSADWRYEVCEPQSCSSGPNITFPFWITNGGSGGTQKSDFCGYKGFEVICKEDMPVFQTPNDDFIIQDISYSDKSLRLVNVEFTNTTCLAPLRNFSSDTFEHKSDSSSDDYFLYLIPTHVADLYFFYNCTKPGDSNFTLSCVAQSTGHDSFAVLNPDSWYVNATAEMCSSYVWQTLDSDPSKMNNYTDLLMNGLTARWSEPTDTPCPGCEQTGGRCGVNQYESVVCFCTDGVHSRNCTDGSKSGNNGTAAKASSTVGGFLVLMLLAYCCWAQRRSCQNCLVHCNKNKHTIFSTWVKAMCCIYSCQSYFWKKIGEILVGLVGMIKSCICSCRFSIWKNTDDKEIDHVLRNNNSGIRRYSYSDVKRMTDSFAVKLGDGGFGDVYKGRQLDGEGKLVDGNFVAVKVLNTSKSNGQDFLNELTNVSKASHVNIVRIFGFCYEGSRRALIFEFLSNGSLAKYIYATSAETKLGLKVRYQIAVGIARGLEYLHRGCNDRIFHFDIKPSNILLDECFSPKISDFGLARRGRREVSVITMSGAKGTHGYMAPELFYNIENVSHKSDIFSYGMMLLEMVTGRPNYVANADPPSQEYSQRWIYRRIQQGAELGLGNMDEEERICARKMVIVSLWCIQTEPSNRPPIGGVLIMLEGSAESLRVPPPPYLCSPPRPEANASSTFGSAAS